MEGANERETREKSGEEQEKEIFPLETHGVSGQYMKGRRLVAGGEVPANVKAQSLRLPFWPSAPLK